MSNILYRFIRVFFVLYFKLRYNPKLIGCENIPNNDPVILIANHTNNLDFISMGITTKRNISFLAKHTLFKGILKVVLNLFKAIPVDRTKKDKTVLEKANKVLKRNGIVGIFPEGTFNKTTNVIAPFKIGAVKLSHDNNVPIIPIAIKGSYKRCNLKIIVGNKYYIKSNDLDLENKKIMKILENMLTNKRDV